MKIVLLGALLLITSCGHHRDVRPGAEGIHTVTVIGEEKASISREALEQSNHYCKEVNKRAGIKTEVVKYIGRGSEEDYKKLKGITKAVQVAGSGAYVFGGEKERNAGGIAGIGATAANAYAGNGYQVTMTFVCN